MTIVIPDLRVRVFGIRHHGPGSARSVRQGLEEFSPDVVLIEGPSDADPLVMLAASESMEPPIALLAYATGEPSKAAFWPFAVFSPEWQALQWAAKNGVQARFCDLPAFNVLADQGIRTVREGDPLSELAAAAGFDDTERWWDSVIESSSGADSFDAITEAMEALRETVPIDEETAHREAYMRQVLRKTLKDGAERVAVVCGAWHAPAVGRSLGAGGTRCSHPQRNVQGQDLADMGSLDSLTPGVGIGLRRRNHLAGLVSPPVHRETTRRSRGGSPKLRGCSGTRTFRSRVLTSSKLSGWQIRWRHCVLDPWRDCRRSPRQRGR